MYTGRLINSLIEAVEDAERSAEKIESQNQLDCEETLQPCGAAEECPPAKFVTRN